MTAQLPPALSSLFDTLSISVEAAEDGHARLALRHTNVTVGGVRGSINGGVVAALAELAAHLALRSALSADETIEATVELSVSYLSSARGDPTVAQGRLLRKGSRLCVSDVEIRDGESGRLNAKARVICALSPGE